MATRVDTPQLGLPMEKGTALRRLTHEGEPLVLLQTKKVECELVDGAPAAHFLAKPTSLLENPEPCLP